MLLSLALLRFQLCYQFDFHMHSGCWMQEFDAYDEDRSGYIDVKDPQRSIKHIERAGSAILGPEELKGLLEKLGEELSEEELDQA